ncbi:threonine aldolase family protein [Phytomonospora endophytica]|uniref:Threonine aldolase n=1 Tax=Phytomonospora endophytica TaxID=714109 RepID=A0A841FWQ8_9ACTN|nr:beta-eliminating lyase-related protein [Phytomonospora endophytica]MBB6036919.1 threonine aldolase [Phytomonospora endophytica]GIG68049.1 threonine aldolase [Phytomonospora endophytica]
MTTDAPRPEIRRSLSSHAPLRRKPRVVLARLMERPEADAPVYGPDSAMALLERRIAELLGKERALFFPSGTMAQQVALRMHAEMRGRRGFAAHPTNHLDLWEQQGYDVVHGLHYVRVGDANELMTTEDLAGIGEPVAAVLWELPQREIGGLLPEWDELREQIATVRSTGAATHLDGARLWEAQTFYERPFDEIAALFDTVYVSLYKGLQGIRGAVLASDAATIAEAEVWRWRLGGQIPDAWPLALAALDGLDNVLPRMAAFRDHAVALAAALNADGIATTVPLVPQTPMFHVHLPVGRRAASEASRVLLEETGTHLFGGTGSTPLPGRCAFEVSVGENAMEFEPEELAGLVRELVERAKAA